MIIKFSKKKISYNIYTFEKNHFNIFNQACIIMYTNIANKDDYHLIDDCKVFTSRFTFYSCLRFFRTCF